MEVIEHANGIHDGSDIQLPSLRNTDGRSGRGVGANNLPAMESGSTPTTTFDFETNGLDWWHRDFRAHSVAFSTDGRRARVIFLDGSGSALQAIPKSIQLTAHNGLFDALVWYRLTGWIPYVEHDTMVLAHLLDENRPKNLKWLGRALLGWPDWDIELAYKTGQGNVSLEEFARYNGADACATWRLHSLFLRELTKNPELERYYYELELPKLRGLIQLVANGIHVDRVLLGHRLLDARANYSAAKEQVPIGNPRSSSQVARWLYYEKGLVPLKNGKTHGSTDEESIKRLAQSHPEVRAILPVRKYAKYLNTYLEPIEQAVNASYDGRFHPEYRSTGTETGRVSSFFHTIPRDSFIRSIFSSPPGYTLVEVDAKQIEARLCAYYANGAMLKAFLEGRDPYIEQAAGTLRKAAVDVTPTERQVLGKVPVLAMLYRISAQGLRDYAWREYELDWTKKEAYNVWSTFHRLWPEFKVWHEKEAYNLLLRGFSRSVLGRLRRLPALSSPDYKIRHEAEGQGINMPVQSLASDYLAYALGLLASGNWPAWRVVGWVHDALLFEVRTTGVENFARDIRTLLENLKPLGYELPEGLLPMEVKIGSWGSNVALAYSIITP